MAKMSPTAELAARLPRFVNQDNRDKVNEAKADIVQEFRESTGMPPGAIGLAARFAAARVKKEEIERELKDVVLELSALSELMDDQFENEGVRTVSLIDGAAVRRQPEPYATVIDQPALLQWALNDDDLRNSLTIHWQKLNSLTKQLLMAGLPEPPGVKAWSKSKFFYTKNG
jgi:hypothetical protein